MSIIALGVSEILLKNFTGLGNPLLYDRNPLYGFRPKPNQVIAPKMNIKSFYGARVVINNLGLRENDAWDASPSGKMLFLGDSVTYGGQYIETEQLFTSVAEQYLPGWQVGNGAVNGWGVENMVGLVVDYGFTPAEVVVTCVIEGDFYRGTAKVASVPFWVVRPRLALQDIAMHFVWKMNQLRYGGFGFPAEWDDTDLYKIVDKAARRLEELDIYLKQRQVKHLIFVLPTMEEVVSGGSTDERVRQALRRHNVAGEYLLENLLSMEPDAGRRREWYKDEVHLAASGHKAYGDIIGNTLSQMLKSR